MLLDTAPFHALPRPDPDPASPRLGRWPPTACTAMSTRPKRTGSSCVPDGQRTRGLSLRDSAFHSQDAPISGGRPSIGLGAPSQMVSLPRRIFLPPNPPAAPGCSQASAPKGSPPGTPRAKDSRCVGGDEAECAALAGVRRGRPRMPSAPLNGTLIGQRSEAAPQEPSQIDTYPAPLAPSRHACHPHLRRTRTFGSYLGAYSLLAQPRFHMHGQRPSIRSASSPSHMYHPMCACREARAEIALA
jgi:hypothetical protein